MNGLIVSEISFQTRVNNEYQLRHQNLLQLPRVTSRQAELSFHYKSCQLWNLLPTELKEATNLYNFKKKVKRYYLQQYQ